MKKILTALFLTFPLLFLVGGVLAQVEEPADSCIVSDEAAANIEDCTAGECFFDDDPNCAVCCLFSGVYRVKSWVFTLVMIISTIFVIYGGLQITTAGGNEDQVKTGRDFIKYAMIGFFVGLLSQAIPAIIRGLLGV